jgi:hypothetical protein
MFALAFRCWLLLSLAFGALGTPWWAVAATQGHPSVNGPNATQEAAIDSTSAMAGTHHDCHGKDDDVATGQTMAAEGSAPNGSPHGHDCDGALCDCGCVLPPLLIPSLLALPAGIAPPAPRLAALPALHSPALNTPFRPPIG